MHAALYGRASNSCASPSMMRLGTLLRPPHCHLCLVWGIGSFVRWFKGFRGLAGDSGVCFFFFRLPAGPEALLHVADTVTSALSALAAHGIPIANQPDKGGALPCCLWRVWRRTIHLASMLSFVASARLFIVTFATPQSLSRCSRPAGWCVKINYSLCAHPVLPGQLCREQLSSTTPQWLIWHHPATRS